MLRLFVNPLTADAKYSCHNKWNLQQPIKMHLSEKQKTFLNISFHFQNLHKILNILK